MLILFNRSAAKLAYPEAQSVIDGGNLSADNVDPQHSANAIEGDIKVLHVSLLFLINICFNTKVLHLESCQATPRASYRERHLEYPVPSSQVRPR